AKNFDVSIEYYFAPEAVVSGGVFVKSIDDFIVDYSTDVPGTYNGFAYDYAAYAINGKDAQIQGFEFAYNQAFTMLPAPWDGLLLGVNYTYTDAEGDLGDRVIPMPAASKHTGNVVLGYEKGP